LCAAELSIVATPQISVVGRLCDAIPQPTCATHASHMAEVVSAEAVVTSPSSDRRTDEQELAR